MRTATRRSRRYRGTVRSTRAATGRRATLGVDGARRSVPSRSRRGPGQRPRDAGHGTSASRRGRHAYAVRGRAVARRSVERPRERVGSAVTTIRGQAALAVGRLRRRAVLPRRLEGRARAPRCPRCRWRTTPRRRRAGGAYLHGFIGCRTWSGERPWAGGGCTSSGSAAPGMSGLALVAARARRGGDRLGPAPSRRIWRALRGRRHRGRRSATTRRTSRRRRRRDRLLDGGPAGQPRARRRARARAAPSCTAPSCWARSARCARTIAVAGTHGKTTTAGMVVHALRGGGMDPGYLVGGELSLDRLERRVGERGVDRRRGRRVRPLAAQLRPEIAVLTNAELDHHTTYGSLRDARGDVPRSSSRARAQAVVVGPAGAARACATAPVVAFDVAGARAHAGGSRFALARACEVRLAVPGAHNALNAAAALEACRLAGADPARAAAALADFRGAGAALRAPRRDRGGRRGLRRLRPPPDRGARRRSRPRARSSPAASSPSSSRTCTRAPRRWRASSAARSRWPTSSVVLDIYRARERAEDHPGVSGRLVAEAAADAARRAHRGLAAGLRRRRALPARRAARRRPVPVLGAGDVDALGRRLVASPEAPSEGRSAPSEASTYLVDDRRAPSRLPRRLARAPAALRRPGAHAPAPPAPPSSAVRGRGARGGGLVLWGATLAVVGRRRQRQRRHRPGRRAMGRADRRRRTA